MELENNGVTGVTGVPASNDMACSGTPAENKGVTGVTEQVLDLGLLGSEINPMEVPPDPDETPEPEIKRPCFMVHDDWFSLHGRTCKAGLWWHSETKGSEEKPPEPIDEWICSPIHCEAITSDEQDSFFGRMLKIRNDHGRWREWLMPMEMLKGSGEELRGELLNLGWRYDQKKRADFTRWLMNQHPKETLTATGRTGWHDDGSAFVFPDQTIGNEDYRFQSEHAVQDYYKQRGSLSAWREQVAVLCVGNPVLMMTLSAAFAGVLLKPAKQQDLGGAGINLMGQSSKGKTSALQMAASVWGSPDFVGTWSGTGNGLEAKAASLNDTLMILDELGQSNPQEIGSIVYLLANGHGKQRASRTGGIKISQRWRLMVLSSGEKTLSAHMAEGGKQTKAGQEARLLDIPAINQAHGVFDCLHGESGGQKFSDRIKKATSQNYGKAGAEFIEMVMQEQSLPDNYTAMLNLPAFHTVDGVEARAAGTFALVAMAGDLATQYGLTGWGEGDAIQAAITGFTLWRDARGQGNTESRQTLEAVQAFIDRHGDSRFSDIDLIDTRDQPKVINRAGYWRDTAGGRIFYFNSDALKEAVTGFSIRDIGRTLKEAGWLAEQSTGGKTSMIISLGKQGKKRMYAIKPKEVS